MNAYDNPTGRGPDSIYETPYAVKSSPDGSRVYVTGLSYDVITGTDAVTIAYDPSTGSRLWLARYNGPQGLDDAGYAVTVSPDGRRVFMTGIADVCFTDTCSARTIGQQWNFSAITVAYDATTGQQLWVAAYGHPGGAAGTGAVAVSADGSRVYAAGGTCSDANNIDTCAYLTLSYDAANGQRLWASQYAGPSQLYSSAFSLALSSDGGRVFVTGRSSNPPDSQGRTKEDMATIAYDAATGAQTWSARFHRTDGVAEAYAIALSPDASRAYITGVSTDGTYNYKATTVAYNARDGQQVWAAMHQGQGYAQADDLVMSPAGDRVYITGFDDQATMTAAYDASTGRQVWTASYDANEPGDALAVSPDGAALYVDTFLPVFTAGVRGPSGIDHVTVAYGAADGVEQWSARYNSAPDDSDRDLAPFIGGVIAVTRDGHHIVVVTHFIHPSSSVNRSDLGILAYDASPVGPSSVIPETRQPALLVIIFLAVAAGMIVPRRRLTQRKHMA